MKYRTIQARTAGRNGALAGFRASFLVFGFDDADWLRPSAVSRGQPLLRAVVPLRRCGGELTRTALFLLDLDLGRGFFFDPRQPDGFLEQVGVHPMRLGALHLPLMLHLAAAADPLVGPEQVDLDAGEEVPYETAPGPRWEYSARRAVVTAPVAPVEWPARLGPPSVGSVAYRFFEAEDDRRCNWGRFLALALNEHEQLLVDLQTREGVTFEPRWGALLRPRFLAQPVHVCLLYYPALRYLAAHPLAVTSGPALLRFSLDELLAQPGLMLGADGLPIRNRRSWFKHGGFRCRLRNREVLAGRDPEVGQETLTAEEQIKGMLAAASLSV